MVQAKEQIKTTEDTTWEGTYLVIQHQVVVGSVAADCTACALKQRDAEYPGAQLAAIIAEDGPGGCWQARYKEGRR